VEVVALAAFLLGADRHPVDTEDIAMKAAELAPGRFSWRKYPEQINLEWVRVRLSEGKGDEYGWLEGKGQEGWTLTPKGQKWAREAAHTLLGRQLSSHRESSGLGAVDERRKRRERARILATSAWRSWQGQREAITEREAQDVFRIDSYSVGRMRHMKVTRLASLFEGDSEIEPFLSHLATLLADRDSDNGTD
jgi:hypothetical protein